MASTNGTIKRLVHDKGFGFIAASDGSEYFFHQSSCQTPFDELREGRRSFEATAPIPLRAQRPLRSNVSCLRVFHVFGDLRGNAFWSSFPLLMSRDGPLGRIAQLI